MKIRPTSVTVIGWILVVTTLLAIPGMLWSLDASQVRAVMAESPLPIAVQWAIKIVGLAIALVCGYFILQRKNWARWLYVGWMPVQLAYSLSLHAFRMLTILHGVFWSLIVIYFLFRAPANQFFARDAADDSIQNRMLKRQISSVCFYIVGGFLLASCFVGSYFASNSDFVPSSYVLGMMSVVPLVLLLIGKLLSPNSNWLKEIGIVLLVSAAGEAVLGIAIALTISRPEFQAALPPGIPVPALNHTTAAIWIGLTTAFGGVALMLGHRSSEPARDTQRSNRLTQ